MSDSFNFMKTVGGTLGAFLASVFGGWDTLLKILITLTILDFITGVLSAIYHNSLSSSIGYRGIIKKIGIYFIIALSVCLDKLLGDSSMLRGATVGFYIVIEATSILENWAQMNLPLFKAIKNALDQLHDKYSNN